MSRIAKVTAVALGTGAMVVSGAGLAMADSGARGTAVDSGGVASGNVVQVPVHAPINFCGNTIQLIGLLNPAFGTTCVITDDHHKGGQDDKDGGHHEGGEDNGYGG
jgi:hypothetical protein